MYRCWAHDGPARIVSQDPAVLILDEATSALDADSEARVDAAIDAAAAARTVLVVSHRRAALMRCDRVSVVEGGRVVEGGAPGALAADASSAFRRLLDGPAVV